MIKSLLDFQAALELIKKGEGATKLELDSALAYANDNLQAIMDLLSALCSGYNALQAKIVRKDEVIEARNQRIHSLNQLLAETNRRYHAAKTAAQKKKG